MHPWGRIVAAVLGVAIILAIVAGFGLISAPSGPESPSNTGEIPVAPDPTPISAIVEAPGPISPAQSADAPDTAIQELENEAAAAATTPAPEGPEPEIEPEEKTAAEPDSPAPAAVEVPVPAPDHVVVEVTEDGQIVPGAAASQAELVEEIKRLNEKFDQLQETVNLVVTRMMSDVESENDQLRAELQRLQARDQAGLLSSAYVPRPAGELLNSLAEDAREMPEEELEANVLPEPAPVEFSFKVISEWGRDPDAVAQLGGNAPTLKGVVGAVPRGSNREDIEQLGRDLRAQYADYDNINIEIFDDPVAAQAYADSQTMDAERRVLSISKYAATSRDAMTYYEDGESAELAPDLDEDEASPVKDEVPGTVAEGAAQPEAPKAEEPVPQSKRGRRSGR